MRAKSYFQAATRSITIPVDHSRLVFQELGILFACCFRSWEARQLSQGGGHCCRRRCKVGVPVCAQKLH